MFFVSAHLGEAHGSAKSARDFARSLLVHCTNTSIVCPRSESFPPELAGYALHDPVWYEEPAACRKRAKGRLGRMVGRLDLMLTRLMRRGMMQQKMRREVVVVNGWASLGYWRSLGAPARRCALIVRESPRHFQYADRDVPVSRVTAELAQFDRLIFVSSRVQDEWLQYTELSGKPSFYFPNCCEEEEVARVSDADRKAIRAALDIAPDEAMAICPGTVEQRKGIDIVLKRWREILDKVPNARLVILGNGTKEFGVPLLKEVAAGSYGPQVTHVEAQPSAVAYISAADLLLFPTKAEALPRAVLEAMAAATPVVTTAVDGIPELIEHDRSGWLFELGDEEAMIAGVTAALNDRATAARWAHEARRRYHQEFSRKRQIERMSMLVSWLNA